MRNNHRLADVHMVLFATTVLWMAASSVGVCAETPKNDKVCAIQIGPCVQRPASGMEIVLDILPRPVKAMSELTFQVLVKQNNVWVNDARVVLDLTMPGMFMGKNQVVLKHVKDGIYEGKGVVTRCASNRKDWQASVSITGEAMTTKALFLFEVQ